MSEQSASLEQGHTRLEELQAEVKRLREEEREIKAEISRLQAELSRSRGRDLRRAQVTRSASLPSLQMQQRRLGARVESPRAVAVAGPGALGAGGDVRPTSQPPFPQ